MTLAAAGVALSAFLVEFYNNVSFSRNIAAKAFFDQRKISLLRCMQTSFMLLHDRCMTATAKHIRAVTRPGDKIDVRGVLVHRPCIALVTGGAAKLAMC